MFLSPKSFARAATQVVKTVMELLQGGDLLSADAIGVIAPYSGQVGCESTRSRFWAVLTAV